MLYRGWIVLDYRVDPHAKTVVVNQLWRVKIFAEGQIRHAPFSDIALAEVRSNKEIFNKYYVSGPLQFQLDPELRIWRCCTEDGS